MGTFGSEGVSEGKLKYPLGVDVTRDGSLLFVADSKNHRVAVFDVATGTHVRCIGEAYLSQPVSVSVSRDKDSVFVRDNDIDRVLVRGVPLLTVCVCGRP